MGLEVDTYFSGTGFKLLDAEIESSPFMKKLVGTVRINPLTAPDVSAIIGHYFNWNHISELCRSVIAERLAGRSSGEELWWAAIGNE